MKKQLKNLLNEAVKAGIECDYSLHEFQKEIETIWDENNKMKPMSDNEMKKVLIKIESFYKENEHSFKSTLNPLYYIYRAPQPLTDEDFKGFILLTQGIAICIITNKKTTNVNILNAIKENCDVNVNCSYLESMLRMYIIRAGDFFSQIELDKNGNFHFTKKSVYANKKSILNQEDFTLLRSKNKYKGYYSKDVIEYIDYIFLQNH